MLIGTTTAGAVVTPAAPVVSVGRVPNETGATTARRTANGDAGELRHHAPHGGQPFLEESDSAVNNVAHGVQPLRR